MYSRTLLSGLLLGGLPFLTSARPNTPPKPSPPGSIDCTGVKGVSPKCTSQETAHQRDFFYIGGGYIDSGSPGAQMWSDQLYVEKLTPFPKATKPYPMVFVAAGINTGAEWLNTPDNRKGWASYYLEQGYQVYIVDNPANGRSGQQNLAKYPLRFGSTDLINEQGFTAPAKWNLYPQAHLHNQWPGNGTHGDPVFDAFTAGNVPMSSDSVAVENTMRQAGCQLLSMIGQSYTFCHSAGCTYTAIWADQCPEYLRANINIEPGNLPFRFTSIQNIPSRPCGLTYTPLHFDPPVSNCSEITNALTAPDTNPSKRTCYLQTGTIRKLTQFGKVPYIMLTGDASVHITYDHCFLEYLEQAGVTNHQWIQLADYGLHGNGHFFFLEKNNIEIAALINRGLDKLNKGAAAPGHPSLPVSVK